MTLCSSGVGRYYMEWCVLSVSVCVQCSGYGRYYVVLVSVGTIGSGVFCQLVCVQCSEYTCMSMSTGYLLVQALW